MPFGLHGAPATFQRMMDRLLWDVPEFAAAYLDDLIIHSTTWEEHLRHVRMIFEKLRSAGLTIKPKKCQLGMTKCVYLGHVVGGGRVSFKNRLQVSSCLLFSNYCLISRAAELVRSNSSIFVSTHTPITLPLLRTHVVITSTM